MRAATASCAIAILACCLSAHAQEQSATASAGANGNACAAGEQVADQPAEPAGIGAGLVLDEHLLTDASRDQDYNGGGEVTQSGPSSGIIGRGLDRALGLIDQRGCKVAGLTRLEGQAAHAFAAGLLVFTPRNLEARDLVRGDRPYASLFFVSAGRRYASRDSAVAYDTSLTVGVLGLAAAADVQRVLHDLTGSVQPRGWSHQVSDGGEPTARYSLARQAMLADFGRGPWRGDSKWTSAASVGTVTEVSVALSARWGHIESPWWAFTPEQDMYVQETQPVPPPLGAHASPEVFAFAGMRLKARAYDAFLQGQFRHSDLTYGEGDLNPVLGEAWAGVEFRSASGWAVQYLARWQSAELRSGVGSRSFLWGSVAIAKSFR
ncbi:MAG TPA: lipid A deacylase LpxR family protein [Steroidobacteraceae bacterium]|nr:lipid A deacylase LpxR family protein [Steroidobacteraceae bacterium]